MTFPSGIRCDDPRELSMRMSLPYGLWRTASGREVLFNREYQPIWSREARVKCATQAKPDEWVDHREQHWFYRDINTPWRSPYSAKKCYAILRAFLDGKSVNQYIIYSRPGAPPPNLRRL